MKIINLNESQFERLFEDGGDSVFLDGKDTTKRFSSENSNQALIDTPDGEEEYSKPIKKYGVQTPQQWGVVGWR